MRRGEITVFLSLIIILVMAFVCTLVESARLQGVRMQLQVAADAACESAFAAYDRQLLEEFKVFFFDGSDKDNRLTKEGIVEVILNDMREIINPNELYDNYMDFNKISLKEGKLQSVALATDGEGMVYREQAIMSMKGRFGISYAEKLLEQCNLIEKNLSDGAEFKKKEKENEDVLVSLEEQKNEIDLEKSDEAKEASKTQNPAAVMSVQKSMGIMQSVLPANFNLSQTQMVLQELPAKRELNIGSGLNDYSTDFLSNILFNEYLMQMFECAVNSNVTNNQLNYQLEYLVGGNAHDADNLKSVAEKLLLIREGANFAYILTDSAKVLEAETLAIALVGYTGLPMLVEATKYAILLSWALAESMLDVKRLLAGKKVSIVKNASNWQIGLSNIASLATSSLNDDSNGIMYKDYLRLLILVQKQETTAKRCLDLVEMKIRSYENSENFRLDNMVCQFEIDIQAQSSSVFYSLFFMKKYLWKGNTNYSINRNFSYSMWK